MNYNNDQEISSFHKHLKTGYLNSDFKFFHLKDNTRKDFPFHYHDFNKILLFLQGDVTYTIEGKSYELQPFDLVLVRAGELHRPVIHSESAYERIILYLSPEFIAQYSGESYDLEKCFTLAADASAHVLRIPYFKGSTLYHTIKALENSYEHPEEYAQELSQRLLFLQFMIHLNRVAISDNLEFLETSTSNTKILECLDYINTHLQEKLTADVLADRFFVSKYYLMLSKKKPAEVWDHISPPSACFSPDNISPAECPPPRPATNVAFTITPPSTAPGKSYSAPPQSKINVRETTLFGVYRRQWTQLHGTSCRKISGNHTHQCRECYCRQR